VVFRIPFLYSIAAAGVKMTDKVFTVDGSNPVAQFVDFLFSVSEGIGDLLKLDAPHGKAREFFDGDSNTRWKSNELHRAAFNDAKTPRLAEAVRIAQDAFIECYEAAYSVTQFDAEFSDFETAKEKLDTALGEVIPFLPPALQDSAASPKGRKSSSRNTRRGSWTDMELMIIAALSDHHQYSNGICGNQTPIGGNKLAEKAKCSSGKVSNFWSKAFGNGDVMGKYKHYENCCADATKLSTAMRLLNGDVTPKILGTSLKE